MALDGESVVRVQDYLNDKIQTPADLESLDRLLNKVKRQQQQLQKQVSCGSRNLILEQDNI